MSSIFAVLVGVAIAGLLAGLVTGFLGMGSYAADAFDSHRRLALGGSILVVLVHSVVFIYMIGTGRAIKDAVTDHGIDVRFYEIHKGYKWQAAPWALSATLLTVATAVLGGVAESYASSSWVHPLVALTTVLVNAFGLPAEYRTIRKNGLLLDKVAEATAAQNKDILDRGEDPALPLSPLSPSGWSVVFACSAWLPWIYIRYVMGRQDLAWWPFALVSFLFLIGAFRGSRKVTRGSASEQAGDS